MGNVDFVELKLLDCGGIIVLWNLSLIEEYILDRVGNLNSLAANITVSAWIISLVNFIRKMLPRP